MNPHTNHIRTSPHAEQRAAERGVSQAAITRAITHGTPTRQANDRLVWHAPDGTVVITDSTGEVVVTVLGKRERPPHDRAGAGRSRHDRRRRGPKSNQGVSR